MACQRHVPYSQSRGGSTICQSHAPHPRSRGAGTACQSHALRPQNRGAGTACQSHGHHPQSGTTECRSHAPRPQSRGSGTVCRSHAPRPQTRESSTACQSHPRPQSLEALVAHPHRPVSYIPSCYMHLTLVYTGWVWGQSPPSAVNSENRGQSTMTGEAEGVNESVCNTIHMLV